MRRRYFFIPLIVIIIITGVLVWSCKHPMGTGIPGIANEGSSGNGGEEEIKVIFIKKNKINLMNTKIYYLREQVVKYPL